MWQAFGLGVASPRKHRATTQTHDTEKGLQEMKVKMAENYKDAYTINEVIQARNVIKAAKEDESTAEDYAKMAIREVLRANNEFADYELLKVEAQTVKNSYIGWDSFCSDSGLFDVGLTITAKLSWCEFIEICAYLSDIWSIDGESNIAGCFNVQRFRLVRE